MSCSALASRPRFVPSPPRPAGTRWTGAGVGLAGALLMTLPVVRSQEHPGKALYDQKCATCHGTDARGSAGPGLMPSTRGTIEMLALVRAGGAQMPAMPVKEISDTEVILVTEYLRTLSRGPEPASRVAAADPSRRITPVTDAMLANPDPAEWLNWRRSLDAWGYSPLDHINRKNVAGLKMAWSWGMEPGPSQTTPLVHDGIMYIANAGNVVQALDARTGELQWEYRRPLEDSKRRAAQTRSLAIYQDLILLNTVDAHIVALDARTGALRWDFAVSRPDANFTFTSGPIVADGIVVAGLTGCSRYDEDTCYIVAIDGRTGQERWRTSTIARPGEPGGNTWGDLPLEFRSGGDAWIPGSYDPGNGTIYWGTAQAKPWARSVRGTDADALYTNATLAIDPRTGGIKWHFQHIPGESYDMDEVFERVLIDYDGKQSVFTMGKLGILWELDRTSGKFIRAVDLGYQNLVDVDPRTGRAEYRPTMVQKVGQEVYFCPSTGGFKSLRAMSYNPATSAFYLPLNLNCETGTFQPVERKLGGGGAGAVLISRYDFHPKSPDQMGELAAMDLRSGAIRWRQRRRAPYTTATLSTAGGLVFVGSWDRYVFAHDAATGDVLWEARLPTMANGFPITYSIDGKQYLAVIAGTSISSSSWVTRIPPVLLKEMRNPSANANGLFVFALPTSP